jgi:uncharacterized membrane protein YagU involved in acid resistance
MGLFHGPQEVPPFKVSIPQRLPSVPRTKTFIGGLVSVSLAVAAGDEVRYPPRGSQLDHMPPTYHLCHRALSVPTTKTSRRA